MPTQYRNRMLKFSRRHGFLNVWLITATCQASSLHSQNRDETPFPPYQQVWTIDSSQEMRGQSQWPTPEGLSEEQVHTIIYPDSNSYYQTPEPYGSWDAQQSINPQDGQWPTYSANNWEDWTPQMQQEEWHQPETRQEHTPFIEEKREIVDLSLGRGQVKQIKKKNPPISSSERLERAISHPESIIGNKEEPNDSPIEGVNEIAQQESPSPEKPIPDINPKEQPPILPPVLPQPLPTESLKEPQETIKEQKLEEIKSNFPAEIKETQAQKKQIVQDERSVQPPALDPIHLFDTQIKREQPAVLKPSPAPTKTPSIITPTSTGRDPINQIEHQVNNKPLKEISINFNNVAMVEYIRFISRISNKNFIFDDEDLQFNVTIVSEEPTTIENLMAALLQELRIRDLSLIEQGNNIIIHRNPKVRSPGRIVTDDNRMISAHESELVTRVFRLNTLDPMKASEIIRPLLSEDALIEVLRDTNNLIITDLVSNINKIAQLIGNLDAPNSGVTIGQYVVRNAFVDSLVDLANKILLPIAQGNPVVLVPHPVSNSIFIVSNAFIVEKALAILQNLDLNEGRTKIFSLENLQPSYDLLRPSNAPQTTQEGGAYNAEGRPAGTGGGPGGAGYGPAGTASGYAPSSASGQYGTEGGYGYGPGGQLPGRQLIAPSGTPESFPLGGLTNEGRFAPSSALTPEGGAYPYGNRGPESNFSPGGIGAEGRLEEYPESHRYFGPGGIGAEGRPGGLFNDIPRYFGPGGIGAEGRASAIFNENTFVPGGIGSASRWARELPVGHIERTLFFIYKLRYRKGDNIEIALRKIANSLQITGTANADLISAINSSQWIESSNALIFTGTSQSLEKVRELILEIDVPLRQVFIEMLILDTTVDDSLSYSVDWINRFGGGTTTGEEGFLAAAPQDGLLATRNFLNNVEAIDPTGTVIPPAPASPLPVATGLLNSGGFAAGVIGTHLTHNGTIFSSIGALVRAVHSDAKADIILNPKVITEDNNPAEIFVGGTDRYKTQSITNDLGTLVTNNFQFIDVGTTLRVTPLIGNNGIVTLEIVQETTEEAPGANINNTNNQAVNLVKVLNKTRTVTKIHVPNGFFVVMSGMVRDNQARNYVRIPCLGGIPFIGAFGKTQNTSDTKRCLMLFIRPMIIESDEDYEDITKRQQDVYREKCKFRRSWNYEIDEALEFGNIKHTDPDDMDCSCSDRQNP